MKRQVVWLILSCLVALSLVLASCGTAAPEEEEEEVIVPEEEEEEEEEEVVPVAEGPQYGGTITYCYAEAANLKSPNPLQAGPGIIHLNSYTQEKMGVVDWTRSLAGTGEFNFTSVHHLYPYVGALAESWEQTDLYTMVFHLRQGIHWHDKPPVSGREFVADDVVSAFNNTFYNHPEVRIPIDAKKIESITALDKYTVEIKMNTVYSPALDSLMIGDTVFIYPPEMEETYGKGWATTDGVCGTGPFIMTDFVSGSSATFEKNPDYWAYDELNPEYKIPYVDGIRYLFITDESTRLSALRTAKIDYMVDIDTENTESLKKTNPEMKWFGYPYSMTSSIVTRADREPFSDIRVRKALSMAIDREEILREYFGGQGEIVNYPFTPEMKEVYTPLEELPEDIRENYEYNPEKAKQLLTDAGYPDGFQTECITTQTGAERVQIMIAYWQAIGIDCEIEVHDATAMVNLTWGKKYEAMAPASSAAFTPLSGMESKKSDAYFNYEFFNDPVFDEGVDLALQTLDKAELNQMLKELNLRYLAGCTKIYFPSEYHHTFWWPWLSNYHGEPMLGSFNQGGMIARLWIDQELKKEMGY